MTDMIERMAKAMCDAEGGIWEYSVDEPNKNTPMHSDSQRDMYLAHAKAALTALQDPTDKMISAGLRVLAYYAHEGRAMTDEWLAKNVLEAMIKAAKGDEG